MRAHVRAMLPSDLWFFLRGQEQFQKNPDSYNGAVRENYTWSQDYTDLELKVPVPEHVVKGRQVTGLFPPLMLLSSSWLLPIFSLPGLPSITPTCLLKPVRSGVGRAQPAPPVSCAVCIAPELRPSNCSVLTSYMAFSVHGRHDQWARLLHCRRSVVPRAEQIPAVLCSDELASDQEATSRGDSHIYSMSGPPAHSNPLEGGSQVLGNPAENDMICR